MSTAGLGAAYGLAGFCAGPILGAVLTVAAAGRDPLRGAVLLGVYALGITAPLFALAGLWQRCDIGRPNLAAGPRMSVGSAAAAQHLDAVRAAVRGPRCRLRVLRRRPGTPDPDTRTALSIEDTVAALGADVPDTAVLGALAAGVVVIVVWRLRHSPARRPRDGASGSTRTVERVEPAPPSRTQPEDHRTTQG